MNDNGNNRPDCGLYIHVPFCQTKCGYCDFFSVALNGQETAPLVDALNIEISLRLERNTARIVTIFCGGGTPTLLPLPQLASLLETIRKQVSFESVTEFTIEANPATVDAEKAALLVELGVDRVSLGAQSFVPAELAALERIHDPADIPRSLSALRDAGLRNINLDLIFGIPGQTPESWSSNLKRAIDLQPTHISAYGLTYEPGTRLTAQKEKGEVRPCVDIVEAQMYEHTVRTLHDAGFKQYEISNYARPGFDCRHNLLYWRNRSFIGAGPSAAGFIDGRRYRNVASVDRYVDLVKTKGHAESQSERLSDKTLQVETIMMQMRLNEGMFLPDLRRHVDDERWQIVEEKIDSLHRQRLVCVSPQRVALTGEGRLVANHVIKELVCAVPV